jgi:hypothetical protein
MGVVGPGCARIVSARMSMSRFSVQLTFVFASLRSAAVLNGRIGLVSVCSKQTIRTPVLQNYQSSNANAILDFSLKRFFHQHP